MLNAQGLDNFVEVLRAGKSPLHAAPERNGMPWPEEGDIDLLQMASALVGLTDGAASPDPAFTARLRERLLFEVEVSGDS